MANSKALRKLVESRGLKYKYIAGQIGITPYCLARKIDNKVDFKAGEIAAFCRAVGGVTPEQQMLIFFGEVVDKNLQPRNLIGGGPACPEPS